MRLAAPPIALVAPLISQNQQACAHNATMVSLCWLVVVSATARCLGPVAHPARRGNTSKSHNVPPVHLKVLTAKHARLMMEPVQRVMPLTNSTRLPRDVSALLANMTRVLPALR